MDGEILERKPALPAPFQKGGTEKRGRVDTITTPNACLAGGCERGTTIRSSLDPTESQVFATGPPVVKQGLNKDVTKEELGGYKIHSRQSGAVDNEAENEEEALAEVRRFLSYLPRNIWELPTRSPPQDDPELREDMLIDSIPRDRRKVYNVRRLLAAVLDTGSNSRSGAITAGPPLPLSAVSMATLSASWRTTPWSRAAQ